MAAAIPVLIFAAVLVAYFLGRGLAARRARQIRAQSRTARPHSLPAYHGAFAAWIMIFMFVPFGGVLWAFPEQVADNWVFLSLVTVVGAGLFTTYRITLPDFRARVWVERFMTGALWLCSGVAVLTTFGILLSLIFESLRFFEQVHWLEFLTGIQWSPQTAIRADQAGQSGAFGAVPVFIGTFMIMAVALLVAAPVGLLIAVYLAEYAGKTTRGFVKPVVEILAGIPTIVYGFFALLTVGPAIRQFAEGLGFAVPTQSAIAAGTVMGVMIIPFISSLSDDVINAVPQSLRDGSYALGATKSETTTKVIFPAALPGIIGALLLAISRAIGETMIVVMAAGRAANLTGNPFDAVTTVTVQIVSLLTGDQEFDSAKTLAAFALGLVLFAITLILNIVALVIIRRYRERYE